MKILLFCVLLEIFPIVIQAREINSAGKLFREKRATILLEKEDSNSSTSSGQPKESEVEECDALYDLAKRPYDSISGSPGFRGFAKRPYDSISGSPGFRGFAKRPYDSTSGSPGFSHGLSRFAKTPFDSISGSHGLSGFAKRSFDSISGSHGLSGFAKRDSEIEDERAFTLTGEEAEDLIEE